MNKFDWKQFYTCAKTIHQNYGNNDAFVRTAVSRAYYAVYHTLKTKTNLTDSKDNHIALINYFQNGDFNKESHKYKHLSDDELNVILEYLKYLRDERLKADYNNKLLNFKKSHIQ